MDDSRRPGRLHLDGAYRLSDELLTAGTVPQVRQRVCSVHAKGEVLDPVIAAVTRGAPFRHAVGFEVTEGRRITRDHRYDTTLRHGWYPLVDWGWDRVAAWRYLRAALGVDWQRSACTYCPFALTNRAGRARVLTGFAATPQVAMLPLLIEHVAVALNPRQGLIPGGRLVDLLRGQEMTTVLDRFTGEVAEREHAVYEVRRVYRGAGNAARSVHRHASGTRPAMLAVLQRLAAHHHLNLTGPRLDLPTPTAAARVLAPIVASPAVTPTRAQGSRRTGTSGCQQPCSGVEHFYVVAPATVVDKTSPAFERAWAEAMPLQTPGFLLSRAG